MAASPRSKSSPQANRFRQTLEQRYATNARGVFLIIDRITQPVDLFQLRNQVVRFGNTARSRTHQLPTAKKLIDLLAWPIRHHRFASCSSMHWQLETGTSNRRTCTGCFDLGQEMHGRFSGYGDVDNLINIQHDRTHCQTPKPAVVAYSRERTADRESLTTNRPKTGPGIELRIAEIAHGAQQPMRRRTWQLHESRNLNQAQAIIVLCQQISIPKARPETARGQVALRSSYSRCRSSCFPLLDARYLVHPCKWQRITLDAGIPDDAYADFF